MSPALEQLVREVTEVTGAPTPDLLEDDAPVLVDAALVGGDESFYLVGLIGGKDVGKSALVNALVGRPITAVTSHGAGTEIVIAYSHVSQEKELRSLLEREVPGEFRIVTHDLERLRRQVLVDLPDIDSKYASHLQVTRKMLRHMLYPVWVGSVEKYADQQPQQMLARVAEGNTPGNFIFCLNKVDQLAGAFETAGSGFIEDDVPLAIAANGKSTPTPWGMDLEDESDPAAPRAPVLNPDTRRLAPVSPFDELRADYAARIARTLKLSQPPQVHMISAKHPARFELPALRNLLSKQKSPDAVRESKQSATARQDAALLVWLESQQLSLRAQRLGQLHQDAEELVAAKIAGPVLERIVPRLLDDPASRSAMADEILQERVARWPIVNLVHTLLQPLFILLRSAVSRGAMPMQPAETIVESVMRESGASVAALVQSAFVQLRQSQPAIAALYPHNKLWEDMPADLAAGNLRRTLADTVQRQRIAARECVTGRGAILGLPFRWLLTIGALLWFPFVQPILLTMLDAWHANPSLRPDRMVLTSHWPDVASLIVRVLGVDYLLRSAGFLIIYFAVLWLALRWNTQRKVSRLMSKWLASDFPDASVNLAQQTVQWLDSLTAPIASARDHMQSLSDRAASLKLNRALSDS